MKSTLARACAPPVREALGFRSFSTHQKSVRSTALLSSRKITSTASPPLTNKIWFCPSSSSAHRLRYCFFRSTRVLIKQAFVALATTSNSSFSSNTISRQQSVHSTHFPLEYLELERTSPLAFVSNPLCLLLILNTRWTRWTSRGATRASLSSSSLPSDFSSLLSVSSRCYCFEAHSCRRRHPYRNPSRSCFSSSSFLRPRNRSMIPPLPPRHQHPYPYRRYHRKKKTKTPSTRSSRSPLSTSRLLSTAPSLVHLNNASLPPSRSFRPWR